MPALDALSVAEVTQVAKNAGFGKDADTLATAVAVAMAESSGRTTAVSPTGCCYGLWQINVNVHPYTKAQMQDPAQNAAAAWKISNGGTNWKPWSAYNNGAYLLWLTSAKRESRVPSTGSANVEIGGQEVDLPDPLDSIDDLMYPISATKAWISNRDNIFRVVKVLAGGAIVVLGLKSLIKQPIQSVIREVKK